MNSDKDACNKIIISSPSPTVGVWGDGVERTPDNYVVIFLTLVGCIIATSLWSKPKGYQLRCGVNLRGTGFVVE